MATNVRIGRITSHEFARMRLQSSSSVQFYSVSRLPHPLSSTVGQRIIAGLAKPALIGFLLFLIGCAPSEEPVPELALSDSQEGVSTVTARADLGVVLAGDEVRHAFTFINDTSERLVVESDQAIKKSCGCTQILPQKREIEAGESAEVIMSVHTVGRDEDVHESALIVWSSASGREVRAEFSLHASLSVGIHASENPLVFEDGEELVRGKQIRFDSSFPADWNTVQIVTNNDLFRVSDIEVDDDGATCRVQCDVPYNKSRIDGSLLVRVAGEAGSDLTGGKMSATIPVTAKHTVLLAAAPSVAMMRVTKDGVGTARVLLFGSAVEASDSSLVERVTCNRIVTWKSKRISKDRAFVDINLADCDRIGEGMDKSLYVTLSTGDSLTIPYVVYRSEPFEEKEKL